MFSRFVHATTSFLLSISGFLICMFLVLQPALAEEQSSDLAFAGAQGFGTSTNGGRDGIWCAVTNLNDSGKGSLRACVETPLPRQVFFNTSGIIRLASPLVIEHPYITIDGSWAPNEGVLITADPSVDGPVIRVATHDVLIQYMRVRAGEANRPTCCRDAISIGSEIPNRVYNVVLDHNSFSWGTDEVVEIVGDSHNITLSWNIISEGLHRTNNLSGPAGRGLHIDAGVRAVSLHHNLFAHNYQRNPGIFGGDQIDMVNNVIYHWYSRGLEVSTEKGPVRINLVKNLYIAQDENGVEPSQTLWYDMQFYSQENYPIEAFMLGNRGYWRTDDGEPEYSLVATDWNYPYRPSLNWVVASRHSFPIVDAYDVDDLERYVLENVGAVYPIRDSVDERVIDEVINRSGTMRDCVVHCSNHAGGWPSITERIETNR